MRPATLFLCLFVVSGFAANAQFTLTPQMGVEDPTTKVSFNNGSYFVPLQSQLSPRLALRLDYKFKQGHGVFLGLATSRPGVEYSFTSPKDGMTNYTAMVGDMQVRFEGGYQFTTKPIYFKKQSATSANTSPKATTTTTTTYSRCGGYSYVHHCCNRNKVAQQPKGNQSWFVKFQPSIGMAFVPVGKAGVETETKSGQPTYTYEAGSYTTALITGAGFEFGAAKRRMFTLNINYINALSDQKATLITQEGGKDVTTTLNSKVSGWNATLGIPISLKKTKTQVAKPRPEVQQHHSCGDYYRMRCRKTI
jgi:hypothetical protein